MHTAATGFDIDAKILTLAVLLSSTLVYSSKGHVSDQTFERLGMIQLLTTQIQCKSLREVSPDLHLVLSDFKMAFESLTPESYLEQCLEQEESFSDSTTYKNEIRTLLKTTFPTIDCHPLPSSD